MRYELSKVREHLNQAVSDYESEMETYGPRVEAALKKYSIPDVLGMIYDLEMNYKIEFDTGYALQDIADPNVLYSYYIDPWDFRQKSDWYNNGERNPLLK